MLVLLWDNVVTDELLGTIISSSISMSDSSSSNFERLAQYLCDLFLKLFGSDGIGLDSSCIGCDGVGNDGCVGCVGCGDSDIEYVDGVVDMDDCGMILWLILCCFFFVNYLFTQKFKNNRTNVPYLYGTRTSI